MQTTDIDPAEARRKAHKAQQATAYSNLQTLLEEGESLLSFTRGKIAGGVQGKLFMGLESFLAPDVNIGLTDRRAVFQHLGRDSDKPARMAPHSFPLSEIINIHYQEADAFHEPDELGRLTLQLAEEQSCRIRLYGRNNCDDAREFAEVFRSLTAGRREAAASPVQNLCGECQSILDNPAKFCPYCGARLPEPPAETPVADATPDIVAEEVEVVVNAEVVETAVEIVAETTVNVEIEAVVEATVEVEAIVAEAPQAEPTGATGDAAPSDEIKSWDAYAQKAMSEKSALKVEGGKA